MSKNRIFIRRRDGRIEVRLNEHGRNLVRQFAEDVVAAENDIDHAWHRQLQAPIDPSRDIDDPVSMLARQKSTASNAELVVLIVDEEFINDGEGWAWLMTLQVALRSLALNEGLLSEDALAKADEGTLVEVHSLQQLLFELAECLS